MANLFHYQYESKWLLDIKKRDQQKAHFFDKLFRFLDDLCVINDHLEFKKNYKDIYPSEIELKKENNF